MADEMENESSAPHTLEVYFETFPEIDPGELARLVNEFEPAEPDKCTIEIVDDRATGDVRLLTLNATLGELMMPIIFHGMPSPDFESTTARLSEPIRDTLRHHRAFALLMTLGGENYRPVEHWIFLYKMALALCHHGAIGVGNQPLNSAYPAGFIRDLPSFTANVEDAPGLTLWSLLREDGQPRQLLADMYIVHADNRQWLITRGFAQCGFNDFVYELQPGEDPEEIAEVFENMFHYLLEHGPVIEAGHTTGPDNDVAFRFEEAPNIEWPFPNYGLLQMIKEEPKKKKRFGLF